MVNVVVTTVFGVFDAVCRTHTDCPGLIVPALLVKVPLQPIEYWPLATAMAVAVLYPLGTTVSEVTVEPGGMPVCGVNPKAFGVVSGMKLNLAVTLRAAVMLTTHVPVPEQPLPLQPANVESPPAAAASVTLVPERKLALHAWPQSIPEGLLLTVPLPVPILLTVSV